MEVKMPRYEDLVRHKKDLLSDEQILWYELLSQTSDILHNTMIEHVDSFSGRYQTFRLSDFFSSLNGILERYSDARCGNKFLIDEFVQVAYLAQKALKHIVSNPSVKIIKVDTKVHATKLKSSGIKTMNYLAKRSGQTIKEKIAPDNKVMTTLTRFSVDTPENRQSMYLLNYLYSVIEPMFETSACKYCKNKDAECYKVAERIRSLLHLKADVRKGELCDVKKEKQRIQNNKLMCDKYYKLVWDSSKLLDEAESKITSSWDKLSERFETLTLWFTVARLLSFKNVKIVDRVEELCDTGAIAFKGSQSITLVIEETDRITELVFEKTVNSYTCTAITYKLNSKGMPEKKLKKLPLGNFVTEFFKQQTEIQK